MNRQLEKKAYLDVHTGLANKSCCEKFLNDDQFISEATAVIVYDLNNLKTVNDTLGHVVGDQFILNFSRLLRDSVPTHDFVGRYGGDEFIIIYEGLQEQEVVERAMRLRKKIMELGIAHAYSKALPIVTISQGICQSIPQEGNKSWDFLHIADEYLYKAKKQERNSICAGTLRGQYQTISLQ